MPRNSWFFVAALSAVVGLAPAEAQTFTPASSGAIDPKAKAIVLRHNSATKPAAPAPKYRHVVAEMRSDGSATMRMEKFTMLPHKILTRTTFPGLGVADAGYDGAMGWANSPVTGPQVLEGEPLKQLRASTNAPLHVIDDQFVALRILGRDTIAGQVLNALLAVTATADTSTYYFDVESGLLAAVRPRQSGADVDTTAMMLFGDYKRYFGTLLPTKLTVRTQGNDIVTRVLHVDQDPIDSAIFAPPAAVLQLTRRTP